MDEPAPAKLPEPEQPERSAQGEEEGGLFVSQEAGASQSQQAMDAELSPRKRGASCLPEDDLMEGMAPAVARFKRQRLEHAGTFASPSPKATTPKASAAAKAATKRKPKEIDVLAMAARHREDEEARARAEREDLAQLPADADLAEIRRLNIVEEMEVRAPGGAGRTREQDVADGRWNPKWNGVKNFKKFRRRGEAAPPPPPSPQPLPPSRTRSSGFVVSDSSDAGEASAAAADDGRDGAIASSRHAGASSRGASATQTQRGGAATQTSRRTSQAREKRAAPEPAPEPRSKRLRTAPRRTEMTDSDGSGDELKFKFGRRR
ncbi:DNA damage response protein RcaA [Ophiocordyceps sinensis CO18]|uniref:DNA damage response protein RcaA n=1 Tax=Ophiocordyceps sinensis (strain Co18 / CGMCC 3.14243) TaxID=911162 RepID=T5ADV0_OPHSC|nr:DNA damage response protein RcaA [Ophiocordyceps sinensis CO18]